jgi:hypothetical protein
MIDDHHARLRQMAVKASGGDEAALLWALNEIERWREKASFLKVALDEAEMRLFRLRGNLRVEGE